MMMHPGQLKKWTVEHQWPVFIVTALVVSVVLTGISMWLYQASGAAKLDLSRPGYEKVRSDVKDDNDSTGSFSPTGNLNSAAVADFRTRYETIKTRLNQMNNYDNTVMSDENLGLSNAPTVTEPIE